jgi:hypothetical protein
VLSLDDSAENGNIVLSKLRAPFISLKGSSAYRHNVVSSSDVVCLHMSNKVSINGLITVMSVMHVMTYVLDMFFGNSSLVVDFQALSDPCLIGVLMSIVSPRIFALARLRAARASYTILTCALIFCSRTHTST